MTVTDEIKVSHPVAYQGTKANRAKQGDAGYDLIADTDNLTRMYPGEIAMVKTGLRIAMPDYLAGLILPRSGLATRYGVTVANSPGLIDSGYRGEIQVALINHSDAPAVISPGMRIAQLVFIRVEHPEWLLVESLDDSERGDGGFGSTGL